jgi:hypothetical protein
LLGIVCGLAAGVVLGTVSTLVVVGTHGRRADQPGGATGAGATRPKAAGMTKAEFYAKLKTFKEAGGQYWVEGRNNAILFMKKIDFDENFGPPSRTQTVGKMVYWYWTVRDGTIQVEIEPSFQPMDKEYFPLYAVNDY